MAQGAVVPCTERSDANGPNTWVSGPLPCRAHDTRLQAMHQSAPLGLSQIQIFSFFVYWLTRDTLLNYNRTTRVSTV